MTEEYASRMWHRYFKAMNKGRMECILDSPDDESPDEYYSECLIPEEEDNIHQEMHFHFKGKKKATANTLILRALGQIRFTNESYQRLISLLAELSASSYGES